MGQNPRTVAESVHGGYPRRPSSSSARFPHPEFCTVKIEHLAWNVEDPISVARWYVENLGFTIKRQIDAPPQTTQGRRHGVTEGNTACSVSGSKKS